MILTKRPIRIGKKNAHQYFGQIFGSYVVLPELKQGNSGEWLIKIRCLECGTERFFKPSSLWKRGKCTCASDERRKLAKKGVAKREPAKKYSFDGLSMVWPNVIRAGKTAMEMK